ncbi:flavodoxin [Paucilactobacillus nenjiangensis]|jgi:flavodoxin short chain|uniref:Flavodoxin n=1 Tax=Paucilactobacillus nenjiangensis TaxID=1296540 RepID=A0A5P1X2K7_9LACO|nr:flavodoxin [Paucilactobacillus nenjiangensis]QER67114.1 flavodoxin [Paucilactobacillus nenjiangensis]
MASALVVFATITGNNEDVADIVTEALEELNVEVEETEITQADAEDFEDVDICVVCPYTYDEGALPEEGLDFYEDLQELDLSGKIFGVAGSGDTFYLDDFNVSVDKFAAAFEKAGAKSGAEKVKIDLDPDSDDIKTLNAFAADLVKAATK